MTSQKPPWQVAPKRVNGQGRATAASQVGPAFKSGQVVNRKTNGLEFERAQLLNHQGQKNSACSYRKVALCCIQLYIVNFRQHLLEYSYEIKATVARILQHCEIQYNVRPYAGLSAVRESWYSSKCIVMLESVLRSFWQSGKVPSSIYRCTQCFGSYLKIQFLAPNFLSPTPGVNFTNIL